MTGGLLEISLFMAGWYAGDIWARKPCRLFGHVFASPMLPEKNICVKCGEEK